MEFFGIIFSIPVAFVASMVYCAIVIPTIRRFESLRRWLFVVSVIVLVGFLSEVWLLITVGAARARGDIGPAFYFIHIVIFFLGTPALANVLLLRRRAVGTTWSLAGICILCTVFALWLVLMQYGVSEALYGINGDDGPYS